MSAWTLVPCLATLRDEFDELAPHRDKASDGSVADARHVAGGNSDHIGDEQAAALRRKDADKVNEVHAVDVDVDLRRAGWTMRRAVDLIVDRHRRGLDDRLQYVIYDGKIASRSWGWTWRDYDGPNPHDKHAHFSSRYTSAAESNTKPWGLLTAAAPKKEPDMATPLTTADADLVVDRLLGTGLGNSKTPTVGVALQSGYANTVKLVAAIAAEVQRDATEAAVLAGMQTALSALAASNGALTPAAVAALTEQVRQAAAVAGAEAVSALQAKLDALRVHLGDAPAATN
mgnify:CR=1 FL=1